MDGGLALAIGQLGLSDHKKWWMGASWDVARRGRRGRRVQVVQTERGCHEGWASAFVGRLWIVHSDFFLGYGMNQIWSRRVAKSMYRDVFVGGIPASLEA